jgi:hypothetical protein
MEKTNVEHWQRGSGCSHRGWGDVAARNLWLGTVGLINARLQLGNVWLVLLRLLGHLPLQTFCVGVAAT